MTTKAIREPARDPQEPARLLIARELMGYAEGMAALYGMSALVRLR